MPDYNKVSFTNRFRYERQILKGSVPFSIGTSFPSNNPTITIPHGLGYKPYVKVWYTYTSGKVYEMFGGANSYGIDGNNAQVDNFYADENNLYITFFGLDVFVVTGRVYYRIYAEPAV